MQSYRFEAGVIESLYGDVLAEGHSLYGIPSPWMEIVTEALDWIREYYPTAKVYGYDIPGGRRRPHGALFGLSFELDGGTSRLDDLDGPVLPRPLRWLNRELGRKASQICYECGHPVESEDDISQCALCTCKQEAFAGHGEIRRIRSKYP